MENQSIHAVQLDAAVFPSEENTICTIFPEGDLYNGAHLYQIQKCLGFTEGKTVYQHHTDDKGEPVANMLDIQFVQKNDDGSIVPGVQSEQLVLVLMDRTRKLNARFPSAQNEKMLAGLQMFLDACRERVEDRMNRGVMGDLKK